MHPHCHPGKAHQRCPKDKTDGEPEWSEQGGQDSQHGGSGSVSGWKGVGVALAIDLTPIAFRAASADAELDDQNDHGQCYGTGRHHRHGVVPESVGEQPDDKQDQQDKPGIP